ncbi:bifunctional enoyl-CoA hydratase/phosphate acetyltransferase [Gracilinema caldarium]|uniref:bifunctional enoyl-CoA hydratase/phosphate acetyltransferase n=1 Tax=Gracilinema caldarium TaxID=215591 RepID=UPI0026EB2EAD|nr:bifunctional enoyl-CoA hydratase/phosphate acetyltransferase [Gracilinema caldarium]
MKSIAELIQKAKSLSAENGRVQIAVAAAQDEEVLVAVEAARKDGFADAVLIGNTGQIESIARAKNIDLSFYKLVDEPDIVRSAALAVDYVRQGKAAFVMKGILDTSVLLKAVLNKETGLNAGRLVSHVGVAESANYHKLFLMTDAAINIAPTLQEKMDIIRNAVDCARALGIEMPKVALLAAVEKVNSDKMPCTVDAAILTQMNRRGQIKDCIVDGPLALDNAISAESARIKKIESPVAGDADILVAPDIEAGNILYKAVIDLGGAKGAGLVMGAGAPVVLTSRADSAETKHASIALAVLVSFTMKKK